MSKAPTFNSAIWQHRRNAVTLTMDHMLATLWKHPAKSRQPTFESVLTALQAFGEQQVTFFLNGFGRVSASFLAPSDDYPPDYVLRATLNQIMYDLNVIGRAWEQRREGLASDIMQETLRQADQLATLALAPAIDHNLIDPAIVVTYFQKDTNVRIIPYAPVSFVGLSLTGQTTKRDLLAIPHELGHYIYRFGKTASGERFNAVLPQPYSAKGDWRAAWMEEIFADVYGALVGGPVMALGFKDLLSTSSRKEFTEDDGEHPVAALRLGIYQAVFEAIDVDKSVRNALEQQGTELWEAYGAPTTFTTVDDQQIDLEAAAKELKAIVRSLLEKELAGFRPTPPWQGVITATDVVTALDDQFVTYVKTLGNAGTPQTDLYLEGGEMVLRPQPASWDGKPVTRKVGATESWSDLEKVAAASYPTGAVPTKVWLEMFDNSGWAMEGPNINPQPK